MGNAEGPEPAAAGLHQRHVCFVLPALGAGGSEHVVTSVANHLAGRGARVSVITFEQPRTPPYHPLRPGVALRQLGLPITPRGALRAGRDVLGRVLRLRRALRGARPDLVISFLTRTNVIAVLAGTGLGIPVVVSERNNPALQYPGRLWDVLRRWTYRRAHGLVTMTHGAMAHFPPPMRRRSWVIPNMADARRFARGAEGERRIFAAVGRLHPQKGFDLLIDAFAAVAPHRPDWTLRIWGEGAQRGALELQVAALGLGDRIQLPGVSPRPGSWIETADAFVLSSRFEGWGLVLGEAMAAGLPCVSLDCHWGPADMIAPGETGLLVPDGNVAALAQAMARLMDDPALRARLGESARTDMARFAPEAIMARWEEMVAGILAESAHAPPRSAAGRTGLPAAGKASA